MRWCLKYGSKKIKEPRSKNMPVMMPYRENSSKSRSPSPDSIPAGLFACLLKIREQNYTNNKVDVYLYERNMQDNKQNRSQGVLLHRRSLVGNPLIINVSHFLKSCSLIKYRSTLHSSSQLQKISILLTITENSCMIFKDY